MGKEQRTVNEFCLVMAGDLDKDPHAPELVRNLAEICINGGVYGVMLVLVAREGVSRSGQLHDALMQLPPPKLASVGQEDSLEVAVRKWKPNYVYQTFPPVTVQIIGKDSYLFFGPSLDSEMYVTKYPTVVEPLPEVGGATPVKIVSTPGRDEFRGQTLYVIIPAKSKKDSA